MKITDEEQSEDQTVNDECKYRPDQEGPKGHVHGFVHFPNHNRKWMKPFKERQKYDQIYSLKLSL